MNPRIKELMLEAGYASPELAMRAQKLAELVIKDCVGECFQQQKLAESLLKEYANQCSLYATSRIEDKYGVELWI